MVGNSNALACKASVDIALSATTPFSPLFVYGKDGFGKTHLLKGIFHAFRKAFPRLRSTYISAEKFSRRFTASLGKNKLREFRLDFRRLDLLVIDDVQSLENKRSTQEELLHTFDALDSRGARLVFAGNSQPKELHGLSKGLTCRFASGFVVKIEPSPYALRLSILRERARRVGRNVEPEVLHFLAKCIDDNVGELIGGFAELCAHVDPCTSRIDLSLAKEVLKDSIGEKKRELGLEGILDAVSHQLHVDPELILSRSRRPLAVLARHISMYLMRCYTDRSLRDVGKLFGGKSGATVSFAEKKIVRLKESDPKMARTLSAISHRIDNLL